MLPPLQSQCAALFRNPSAEGWADHYIEHVACPWRLHMGDMQIRSIKINRVAAPSLKIVLANVWTACGQSQEQVARRGYDVFSGDWCIRQARGLAMPSMHSYALAIDFNAPENPLGADEAHTLFKNDDLLLAEFRKQGWVTGCNWHRRDAMHAQFARIG